MTNHAQPSLFEASPSSIIAQPAAVKSIDCQACLDTGKIGCQYCWCDCLPSRNRGRVIKDALCLASGTIAGLISNCDYDAIEAAQVNFVEWIDSVDQTFEDWRQAWQAWGYSK